MSDGIALLSSAPLSPDDLRRFAVALGGYPDTLDWHGHVSRDGGNVWFASSPEELDALREDHGPQYDDAVSALLGDPPRTYVAVELDGSAPADALALDLAIAFCERWPAVADDLQPRGELRARLLDLKALRRRRDTGQGLWTAAGDDVPTGHLGATARAMSRRG